MRIYFAKILIDIFMWLINGYGKAFIGKSKNGNKSYLIGGYQLNGVNILTIKKELTGDFCGYLKGILNAVDML